MKTKDKFLLGLYSTLMLSVGGFTIISIIFLHNYMKFEKPTIAVQTSFDARAFDKVKADSLSYCTGEEAKDSVNYVTRAGDRYSNVQCTDALSVTETSRETLNGRWVLSHFKQTNIQRTCANKNSATFESCFDTVIGAGEAFVAGVEDLVLEFDPVYMTSWGVNAAPDELVIDHADGRKETFAKDSVDRPRIKVKDLLALADIDLDKQSTEAVGFQAKTQLPMRAPHRMMGGRLIVKLEISNLNMFRPLSRKVVAKVNVKRVTTWEPYGPGVEVVYKGSVPTTLQSHDEVRVEREWTGFSIEFESGGLVGKTDPFAVITALTNAFVLMGMCTLAVDKIGEFFSEQFFDDKYEDDEERAGLEKMLDHMQSKNYPGLPFDPNDLRLPNDVGRPGMSYETALYSLMRQQKDVEGRLNTLLHVSRNGVPGQAMAYDYARTISIGAPAEGASGGALSPRAPGGALSPRGTARRDHLPPMNIAGDTMGKF